MAGSVRKEADKWYYVLETKVNGKRKQIKKRGFKTKREAHRALTEAENAYNRGTFIEPNRMLYSEYVSDWMRNRRQSLKRQTFEVNMGYINTHILPSLGHIPLSEIRAPAINNFVTELGEKGLANSTIKRIFSIVNTSLNHAEKMQIIAKNFASLVDRPKVQKRDLKIWDIKDIKKFLETANKTRYYIAFHLAIMTGMRQGEILGLRWSDVDFENKQVSIRQTLSHDGKELHSGAKTTTSIRTVALDIQTIEVLKKHRRKIIEERLSAGDLYEDNDLIVCTQNGTPVIPRNISRSYYQIIETAELPHITFHDLRHTHASILLSQNIHPKIVSERLGHSSIQITLDTYSHLFPNMQKDAAQELGDLLLG